MKQLHNQYPCGFPGCNKTFGCQGSADRHSRDKHVADGRGVQALGRFGVSAAARPNAGKHGRLNKSALTALAFASTSNRAKAARVRQHSRSKSRAPEPRQPQIYHADFSPLAAEVEGMAHAIARERERRRVRSAAGKKGSLGQRNVGPTAQPSVGTKRSSYTGTQHADVHRLGSPFVGRDRDHPIDLSTPPPSDRGDSDDEEAGEGDDAGSEPARTGKTAVPQDHTPRTPCPSYFATPPPTPIAHDAAFAVTPPSDIATIAPLPSTPSDPPVYFNSSAPQPSIHGVMTDRPVDVALRPRPTWATAPKKTHTLLLTPSVYGRANRWLMTPADEAAFAAAAAAAVTVPGHAVSLPKPTWRTDIEATAGLVWRKGWVISDTEEDELDSTDEEDGYVGDPALSGQTGEMSRGYCDQGIQTDNTDNADLTETRLARELIRAIAPLETIRWDD